MTLAIAAAAACYNIRILEKHCRETGQTIESPLLNHPLEGEIIENVILHSAQVFEYLEGTEQTAA